MRPGPYARRGRDAMGVGRSAGQAVTGAVVGDPVGDGKVAGHRARRLRGRGPPVRGERVLVGLPFGAN